MRTTTRMTTISAVIAIVAAVLFQGAASAETLSGALQKSYALEAKGSYTQALAALDTVPGAEKARYVVLLRRGWLLYLNARYDDAIAAYRKAIDAEPSAVEPKLGIMLPQMAALRWVDAEKSAREVLAIEPKCYTGMSRLAWIQYNLGRYADAEKTYRTVVRAYPSDVEMRAGLGWSLLKLGKADEAAKAFREVLAISPTHTSAQQGLATLGQAQ